MILLAEIWKSSSPNHITNFIIFKKDGEEVFTVSKFLICAFAPVKAAKTKADIHMR